MGILWILRILKSGRDGGGEDGLGPVEAAKEALPWQVEMVHNREMRNGINGTDDGGR